MRPIEIIILIIASICCTGGIGWLLYDMNKQIEIYKQTYKESTLGLVEEEKEDKEK